MSWTNISKPAVGDPTKKQAFADTVVDDLLFLYNQLLTITGSRETIINGSFESDVDGDGYPDGWTRTQYTGGTILHDTSVAMADGLAIHGKRSVKITSPGGGGNGGYQIESTDHFEISEGRYYFASWQSKSTVAGIHNLVEIQFYDSTKTSISTTNLYDSAANPVAWTLHQSPFTPPANARYAKIRLIGAKNDNTTAGSVWFDDVRVGTVALDNVFTTADILNDTGTPESDLGHWICPAGVYAAQVEVFGGGGGGGNSGSFGGGGGGGGGYAKSFCRTVPGTAYAYTVGRGDIGAAATTNNDGAPGDATTITIGAVVLTGNGGAGGKGDGGTGAGGAGGTGTGGTENLTGADGGTRVSGTGGTGGYPAKVGLRTIGAAAASNPGIGIGCGGSGAGTGGTYGLVGGQGRCGAIIIRY